ncbi:MAG: hypothetical protein EA402_04260 [Planctomycetota bacterium]|nr:MAG: hypothetical protein EA402_04260 [Planctomycetota bacterium]
MSDPLQQTIDGLFERLEQTSDPGQVSQLGHALRIQISHKVKKGLPLSPRERSVIAARGVMRSGKRRSSTPWFLLIVALGALAALWWW